MDAATVRRSELSGKRFGGLTVEKFSAIAKSGHAVWRCTCECGRTVFVATKHLGRGTKSCGCLRKRRARLLNLTHGHHINGAPSKTYSSWRAMIKRCYHKTHIYYKNYGGRGIKVCDPWHTFENFLADMGERPLGKTLDRYPNNDGNYEPSNCRWASLIEQANNRHRSGAHA